uniref:Uncharacterized protein n=1 Tax=Setaria italica TaxID=4555 RepID=K3Y082_SETIT
MGRNLQQLSALDDASVHHTGPHGCGAIASGMTSVFTSQQSAVLYCETNHHGKRLLYKNGLKSNPLFVSSGHRFHIGVNKYNDMNNVAQAANSRIFRTKIMHTPLQI